MDFAKRFTKVTEAKKYVAIHMCLYCDNLVRANYMARTDWTTCR